jgi:hypothetical protein
MPSQLVSMGPKYWQRYCMGTPYGSLLSVEALTTRDCADGFGVSRSFAITRVWEAVVLLEVA